jgi:sulfite exporter TauE/SafE/copper chaperone CopZ
MPSRLDRPVASADDGAMSRPRVPRDHHAAELTTLVVPIEGMTCRTCERRIERQVRRIPGVESAAASAPQGRVRVVAGGPLPEAALAAAIEAAGYRVGRDPWLAREPRTWLAAGVGVALVAAVALALEATGLLAGATGVGALEEGGLIVAALLGLAAGVSTCMALTGGIVLALSAAHESGRPAGSAPTIAARLRPTAAFLAGRLLGFAVLGAALGGVGSVVMLPPLAVAALMIAVAVVMSIVGIRLTGVSPRVAAWSPTLPSGLGRRLGLDEGAVRGYTDGRAAVLGAATFFLPCGFTQAVQVFALSTGSPLHSAAIMTAFALGTAPGLLAVGGLPALISGRARPMLLQLVGVVVLGFAMANATAGLRLAGFSPSFGQESPPPAPAVTFEDGVQVLRTYQVVNGYLPEHASLYAGVPTRWIIESQDARSCAIFLQVPALGLSVTLREGENAIDLPPLEPGRINYSCSMGMYGGRLTVVERPAEPVEGAG